MADDIARLVGLTSHTDPTPDPSGRLLCDIDLAILGSEPETFDTYDRQIREEYAWVPEPEFRAARAAVLASLLPADADRERFMHVLGIHGDPVAAKKRIAEADRKRHGGVFR